MEHGDDGRSRDDVMDGPASPPDEPERILDPFRKAFAALAAACFPWDTGLIRSTR